MNDSAISDEHAGIRVLNSLEIGQYTVLGRTIMSLTTSYNSQPLFDLATMSSFEVAVSFSFSTPIAVLTAHGICQQEPRFAVLRKAFAESDGILRRLVAFPDFGRIYPNGNRANARKKPRGMNDSVAATFFSFWFSWSGFFLQAASRDLSIPNQYLPMLHEVGSNFVKD